MGRRFVRDIENIAYNLAVEADRELSTARTDDDVDAEVIADSAEAAIEQLLLVLARAQAKGDVGG